ncbi:MAG: hypothetical protein QNJ98_16580 [Planctomycetota bacterium]|nr:hypothetical protein [Planctomycetota bacterium]
MIGFLGLLLLLGLPTVAYLLLRPKGVGLVEDFMPFPLILRAAGGLRQYPVFLLLGALANAPLLVLLLGGEGEMVRIGILMLVFWAVVTMPLLVQSSVADGALRPLRRRRASAGEILKGGVVGLGRGIPVAAIATAATLLPLVGGALFVRSDGIGEFFLLTGGFVAAVIASALYLAPAIVVDRDRTVLGALHESLVVTFGYRLRILGIVLFFGVVQLLLSSSVLSWLTAAQSRDLSPLVLFAVIYPVSTVVGTWHAITAVIVYHRLRKLRYGGEVDGLLDVFE